MALHVKTDGSVTEVKPKNGNDFKLGEIKEYIGGGYVEITSTNDGRMMLVDEEGKLKGLPVNDKATALHMFGEMIVGDVLICDNGEVI